MKPKTLVLLGGIFTLLLITAVYPQLKQEIAPPKTESTLAGAPDLNKYSAESLTKAEFVSPSETITLEKSGNNWLVNGKKAGKTEIERLISALGEFEVKELAGENAANHTGFGVAETGSATLTLNGETSVVLGNSGYQANSFYLRGKDDAKVYLASGGLGNLAKQNAEYWRDKEIVSLDAKKIARFMVESEKGDYSVEKAANGSVSAARAPQAEPVESPAAEAVDSPTPEAESSPTPESETAAVWTVIAGDKTVDVTSETAETLETAFSPLIASGFLTAEESKAFEEQTDGKSKITAFDVEGNQLATITVVEENALYKGKAEGVENGFKLPAFKLDVFMTTLPDLLNPPATETPVAE